MPIIKLVEDETGEVIYLRRIPKQEGLSREPFIFVETVSWQPFLSLREGYHYHWEGAEDA